VERAKNASPLTNRGNDGVGGGQTTVEYVRDLELRVNRDTSAVAEAVTQEPVFLEDQMEVTKQAHQYFLLGGDTDKVDAIGGTAVVIPVGGAAVGDTAIGGAAVGDTAVVGGAIGGAAIGGVGGDSVSVFTGIRAPSPLLIQMLGK